MKTIGLIGGMSWESTQHYYQYLNQLTSVKLGGLHSAKIILISVDFAEIALLQQQGNWQKCGDILSDAAMSLEKAGADFILICTNTMHIVAEQIQQNVNVPLLHIADCVGNALKKANISTAGLLGTAFTMQKPFMKDKIHQQFAINILTPSDTDQQNVHDIIYHELCLGKFSQQSKQTYLSIINRLVDNGAKGIILGCTEIGLLINQGDTDVPLFDTTKIHVEAAVDFALAT